MTSTQSKVTFTQNVGFRKELNKRVNAYFQSKNVTPRDNPAMYVKTAIILLWVASAWTFALFAPVPLWAKAISCIFLGFGISAIGFSIGHDANHGGYSSRKWLNMALSVTFDAIGVSSYLWRYRHNFLHHTYTNVLEHDVEIHGDGLVRMTPYMERQWYHRYQHIFINCIYAIIPFYWSIADVHLILFKRKYHSYTIPQPKALDIVILLVGKGVWLGLFFGIPILVGYTPLQALIGFWLTFMVYGILACNVFMLAHVLEDVEFIQPSENLNQIDSEWAIFQVKTTADFAPKNWVLNWWLGGLNYQTVHHLFPQVCHIHYPNLAPILADVCQEFGVVYHTYPTLGEALVSNYRWLKRMGSSSVA